MKRMQLTKALLPVIALLLLFTPGAPAQSPSETASGGGYLLFDEGTVQYPSNYRNPMDDLPDMEEPAQYAQHTALPDNLPTDVCPLEVEREAFRRSNVQTRESLISGVDTSSPRMVIFTRSRTLHSPLLVGGTILLHRTVFNHATESWEADISLGDDYLCGGRMWRVLQDDSLAKGVSVLAVGPGVVLLSVEGRLAYLRPPGSDPVEFRLIWDTGIDVEFQQGAPDAAAPAADTKAAPPAKAAPPRRRPGMPGGAPQRAPQRQPRPTAQ